MRWLALPILAFLCLAASPVAAQRNCVKGKPCGNTCIARDKVCRVGTSSPAARPLVSPTPALPDSVQWIGWREAKLYFRARCTLATAVPLNERVLFRSEAQAKDSGFKRSMGDTNCKPSE
jgi:hypothetical protein